MRKISRRRFYRFLKREGAYAAYMSGFGDIPACAWLVGVPAAAYISGAFVWMPIEYWNALHQKWNALLNKDFKWKWLGTHRSKSTGKNLQMFPRSEKPLWQHQSANQIIAGMHSGINSVFMERCVLPNVSISFGNIPITGFVSADFNVVVSNKDNELYDKIALTIPLKLLEPIKAKDAFPPPLKKEAEPIKAIDYNVKGNKPAWMKRRSK